MRGGKCRRLSVTSTAAAAAVTVGGVFVCSGTAPSYSLLTERQPALHCRPWVGSGVGFPFGGWKKDPRGQPV